RKIGGTTVVQRDGGRTLLRECATAYASSPDALGLISWNEFSENTYIEPSQKYGDEFLQLLAQLRLASPPNLASGADSSEPAVSTASSTGWPAALGAVFLLVLFGCVTTWGWWRRRRRAPQPP